MVVAHPGRRSRFQSRLAVEPLESRCLLAAELTRLPVPAQAPFDVGQVVAGPDGNLWVTESLAGRLTRMSPDGQAVPIPLNGPSGQPEQIQDVTVGPDGNLWVTEGSTSTIDRVSPSGAFTAFAMPQAGTQPQKITAGPDGNLWFTVAFANEIGRMTTQGQVTLFPITSTGPWTSGAEDIAAGLDGNLWFTDPMANAIGRSSTSGQATLFPLAASPGAQPAAITAGDDGSLWFTEAGQGKLGRITPAGAISEYAIPGGGRACNLTAGPDGNVWFTDQTGKLGKITPTGSITEYGGLAPGSQPYSITSGPGGSIWFTDRGSGQLGKLDVATLPAGSGQPLSAKAGQAFSGDLLVFNDPNATASQLSAAIDWGDGSHSAGTIVANPQGGLSVLGSNTYVTSGTDSVTITITEPSGMTATFTTTANVANPPADPSIPALPAGGTSTSGVGVPVTPIVPLPTRGTGGMVSIQQTRWLQGWLRLEALLSRMRHRFVRPAAVHAQVVVNQPLPRAMLVRGVGWQARHRG